ncbi:MAG: hypothetical protein WBC83_02905 [Minisyncoccia bacterium]
MDEEYFKIDFPKVKPSQKWLEAWWQKNINTFLYAVENPDVQKAIQEYRNFWLTGEVGTTPNELKRIIQRIFLKDCERNKDLSKLTYGNGLAIRRGDDYYVISKDGQRETEWKISNPFEIFNSDEILKPQTKMRLVEMLANPSEYGWLFETRHSINEEVLVYPSSHTTIYNLHKLTFLHTLDIHILGRYNLDYFVFWPMFFYYAITNDVNFVIKNVAFLHYPVKLFLVKDGEHEILEFRLYGNCNFNEISNFISDNKKKLDKLNRLMGPTAITSSGIRDYHYYRAINKHEGDGVKAIDELQKAKVISLKVTDKETRNYSEYLKQASLRDSSYGTRNNNVKDAFSVELNQIRATASQVKKEVDSFSTYSKYSDSNEIEELIDDINKLQ